MSNTAINVPMFLGLPQVIPFSILMSPVFILTYLLISSFFNADLKGGVYLIGMGFTILFGNMAKGSLGVKGPNLGNNTVCDMFFTWDRFRGLSAPDMNVLLISFTMFYMIMNMFINGNVNLWPMVLFSLLIGMTSFYKLHLGCSSSIDIVTGILLGLTLGVIYYFIVRSIQVATDYDLLYFGKDSRVQEKCKKTKTKFVCKPKKV